MEEALSAASIIILVIFIGLSIGSFTDYLIRRKRNPSPDDDP